MAALFFTNHRMKDVSSFFQVWRNAADQKMRRADDEAKIVSQKKKINQKPIEIDTELANQEIFENYAKNQYVKEETEQQDDDQVL
jgi:hypothetical protein